MFIDAVARSQCFLSALNGLADRLNAGDTLLITMSGHGGQIPDPNGSEPDKLQETWVLFDRELPSSEIYEVFSRFKKGVTIVVVQDASHGSAFRRPSSSAELRANLIVIAGARENQLAMDGKGHGAFTEALLSTWSNGEFSGDYRTFVEKISRKMPDTQSPQLYGYGPDPNLLSRKPFSLATDRAGQP